MQDPPDWTLLEESFSAEAEEPEEADVPPMWHRLRSVASDMSLDDLRSGAWFAQLLRLSLRGYTRRVTPEWMREKYPSIPLEGIVDRRVRIAQNYAMLAGGLSAGAYATAVSATIGSLGGASPITLPAAVASIGADLFFTSMLQLRLAWDLAVLYGHPLDLDDPEDVFDLLRVAFGIKAGEAFHNSVAKLAPEAVRVGVKKVASGQTLTWLKALPVIGKFLLQRNLIKVAIPVVSVPMSAGINYFSTGAIARSARAVFRKRALVPEQAEAAVEEGHQAPLLALHVAYLVVRADRHVTKEEGQFVGQMARLLQEHGLDEQEIAVFRDRLDRPAEAVLADIAEVPVEDRAGLFEVACHAAAIDGKLQRREHRLLKRIAAVCEVPYERARVVALAGR